jgi:hypothetical protein
MKGWEFLGGLSGDYQIHKGCASRIGFSFGAMHMRWIWLAV